MNRINTLSDLFIEELADLLNAENHLAKVLPNMADAAQASGLKIILENHLEIIQKQARRLQDIFGLIGQNARGVTSQVMKGFLAESEDMVLKMDKGLDRDAAVVNLWQRVEQYEIAKYKITREHAADLGHTKIVELLTATLNEERAMNFHLNELAQYMINVQAINPAHSIHPSDLKEGPPAQTKGGGFYIPEGKFSRSGIKKNNYTDESRFINEGNPNIQEFPKKKEEQEGQEP